jgi:hypothetical protein
MPVAIPVALGLLGSTAFGLAAGGTVLGIALGTTTLYAIGIGLTVLAAVSQYLLTPQPPKPKMEDGSLSLKQDIGPRTRLLGRYRTAGQYVYWNTDEDGNLKQVLAHCAHQVHDMIQYWFNDEVVGVDEDGGVLDGDTFYHGEAYATLKPYFGAPDQVVTGINDDWLAHHKLHGICCTYLRFSDGSQKTQPKIYPSGIPVYAVTILGAMIYDPRDITQTFGNEATYKYSENAALHILDFLTRTEVSTIGPIPVGYGFDIGTINIPSFIQAADDCEQLVPLKAGGTQDRYRICGMYDMNERRLTILQDMLASCNGRLIYGPDGKAGLAIGTPGPTSDVTINGDHLYSIKMKAGTELIDRVNEVRTTYISEIQKWTQVEAGIQEDLDSIDRNGPESSDMKLRFVPSDGQAQRIARAFMLRSNPSYSGTIVGDLSLLNAWGERWINLVIPEIPNMDGLYEVTGNRLNRTDESITVELDVISYDDWFEWNPAVDERDPAPVPELQDVTDQPPVPTGVDAQSLSLPLSGNTMGAFAIISWDPKPSDKLLAQIRYREVGVGTVWQTLPVDEDEDSIRIGPLEDNTDYEAQVQFYGPRSTYSEWSATVPFTSLADPVAPPVPTGLTAIAVSPTQVNLSVVAPNYNRLAGVRFWRAAVNNPALAVDISDLIYTGANATATYVDNPGAGDWWYFATAENWSNIPSAKTTGVAAEVAPTPLTITSPVPPGPVSSYDRRPVVSGAGGVVGASVKLFANAVQVGTGTVIAGGVWSVTPSTDLGIGSNSMTATQTVAGNESVASGAVTISVVAIDTDAWAWIAAMTTRPPFARQTLIKDVVESLKTYGVWAKLDALYLLAAHDSQAARLNGKAPATLTLTATSSPIFTADRGYKGTGLGSTPGGYLATTFNPSTAGGAYALNSAHLGVWVRTASTSVVAGQAGDIGTSGAAIYSKHSTAGMISTFLNDGSISHTAAGTPNNTGHYLTSRTGSVGYAKYHQGVAQTASGVTSTALPNFNFSILRVGGTGYTDAEHSAEHWGSGLTATEASNLYTTLQTYLVAVGAA